MRDFEKVDDVIADANVDLLPQIEMMGVKRVVEIENPTLDIFERRDIFESWPGTAARAR
jgi:hypothetical protein